MSKANYENLRNLKPNGLEAEQEEVLKPLMDYAKLSFAKKIPIAADERACSEFFVHSPSESGGVRLCFAFEYKGQTVKADFCACDVRVVISKDNSPPQVVITANKLDEKIAVIFMAQKDYEGSKSCLPEPQSATITVSAPPFPAT